MTLQKVWIWLKSYWWIPLGVILIAVVSIFVGKDNFAIKLFKSAFDSYSQQIAALNTLQKEKDRQKAELEEKYKLIMAQIEAKYAQDQVALDSSKKEYIKMLINTYKDDSIALSEAFAKEFGINIGK